MLAQRASPDFAAGMLSRYLGRHVEIGALELRPGRALELELLDVKVFEGRAPGGEPVFELPRARAAQSWPRLLVGQLVPGKWELFGPTLRTPLRTGTEGADALSLPSLPPLDLVVRAGKILLLREGAPPIRVAQLELTTTRARLRTRVSGEATGRITVGPLPLVRFSAELEGWGRELSVRAELSELRLARLPGAEALPWSGAAAGTADVRVADGEIEAFLDLAVSGLEVEPPKFEPIAPARSELLAELSWDGERLRAWLDPLRLDDLALRGSVELEMGAEPRVSGSLDVDEFAPGLPSLGRIHPVSLLGLRHRTWRNLDLRIEAGRFEGIHLDFDLALADLADSIAFRRKLSPEELHLYGDLRDVVLRMPSGSAPLEDISGHFEISGNVLRVSEMRIRREAREYPALNVTIDGMHRLVRLPVEERSLPRGPGTGTPGLVPAARALGGGEGPREHPAPVLRFRDFQIAHPALLLPIRDAQGSASFPSGKMVIDGAEAVVGGVPGLLSFTLDGPEGEIVARLVYGDGDAPPRRDPGDAWASGAIELPTLWLGDWRLDELAAEVQAVGASVAIPDFEARYAGGPVRGQGELSLDEPGGASWKFLAGVLDAEASSLCEPFGRPPDSITGRMAADGVFRGRLEPGSKFLEHADLGLAVRLEKGTLAELPFLVAVARLPSVRGARGLFGAELPYTALSADITVREGVLRTQNLAMEGPELRALARGSVDLAQAEHPADFVLVFLFLKTVDRVLENVPVFGRLLLGPDRSLFTLSVNVEGEWENPTVRVVLPGSAGAGWAVRTLEQGVGRLRRIFQPQEGS